MSAAECHTAAPQPPELCPHLRSVTSKHYANTRRRRVAESLLYTVQPREDRLPEPIQRRAWPLHKHIPRRPTTTTTGAGGRRQQRDTPPAAPPGSEVTAALAVTCTRAERTYATVSTGNRAPRDGHHRETRPPSSARRGHTVKPPRTSVQSARLFKVTAVTPQRRERMVETMPIPPLGVRSERFGHQSDMTEQ